MAITAYTGLPGSGKSYGVVAHVIVPALESGRRVVTNIPLNDDAIADAGWAEHVVSVSNDDLSGDTFWTGLEGGEVIVIDEVWRLWPSGQRAAAASEAHKSGLAEHRHRVGPDGLTQEIVLVTQDLAQLSAWVRQLVERTYRAVKLGAVGADNKYRIDIYDGAVDGQRPPESRRLSQEYGTYSEKVWRYYSSHTQSSTGLAGTEKRTDRRGVVWRSGGFVAGAVASVVFLGLGVAGLASAFGALSGDDDEAIEATEAAPLDQQADSRGAEEVAAMMVQADPPRVTGAVAGRQADPVMEEPLPLSQRCRITGSYKPDAEMPWQLVVECRGYTRILDARLCPAEAPKQWVCELAGERVTRYSGYRRDTLVASSHDPLRHGGG